MRMKRTELLAEVERSHDLSIPLRGSPLQIVEQSSTLRDHPEQTAPRVVVLDVGLEVLGQVRDSLREKRDRTSGDPVSWSCV